MEINYLGNNPQLQLKSILQRLALYFRLCDLTTSDLLSTFLLPLFLSFTFSYILPEYEISSLGLILLFLWPTVTLFLPVSIQITSRFPQLYINTRLIGLIFIILSQLIIISSPDLVPPAFGEHVTEPLLGGLLSKKTFFGNIVMFLCHGSFFSFGFYWMLYEKDLPHFPTSNIAVILISIYYIFFKPIYLLPSKDFLYLTAGYVTYHTPEKRFWYHFGGWSWVYTVVMCCKMMGHYSYENPGIFFFFFSEMISGIYLSGFN